MIESCWPWMKKKTTRQRAPSTTEELEKVWKHYWNKQLS